MIVATRANHRQANDRWAKTDSSIDDEGRFTRAQKGRSARSRDTREHTPLIGAACVGQNRQEQPRQSYRCVCNEAPRLRSNSILARAEGVNVLRGNVACRFRFRLAKNAMEVQMLGSDQKRRMLVATVAGCLTVAGSVFAQTQSATPRPAPQAAPAPCDRGRYPHRSPPHRRRSPPHPHRWQTPVLRALRFKCRRRFRASPKRRLRPSRSWRLPALDTSPRRKRRSSMDSTARSRKRTGTGTSKLNPDEFTLAWAIYTGKT